MTTSSLELTTRYYHDERDFEVFMSLASYIKEIRQKGLRCFTLKQLMADMGLSKNAALNAVHRIKVQGELISPVRGLYIIVPPEHKPHGSIPAEELVPIIMKYIDAEYYVALLSAAAFYGAAHQKIFKFQVITNSRITHPLEFGQIKIEVIKKKSLSELPIQEFIVNTGYLKVATPDLVAIDLLNYVNRSGGLNHVATVLSELVESIDVDKLIDLAHNINAGYQLQRIGYILENIEVIDEDKKDEIVEGLAQSLEGKMQRYIPLDSGIPKTGYPRCKKWKIIENTEIESDL